MFFPRPSERPGRPVGRGRFQKILLRKRPIRKKTHLPDLFLQWLSFYGPVRKSSLKEVLGLEDARLDDLLAGLAEAQEVVLDLLTEQAEEMEICDRENLEILLRMARRSRQPSFQALGLDRLPLFLAAWQGLTRPGQSPDDLQAASGSALRVPGRRRRLGKAVFCRPGCRPITAPGWTA